MGTLKGLFLFILNMSITATYVAIAIIAIRILFMKKIPKIFSYALWGILLFRLCCPISFSSDFSFFNLINPEVSDGTAYIEYVPQNIDLMQTPTVDVGVNQVNNMVNTSLPKATEVASINPMQVVIFVVTIIWIVGILVFVGYSIFTYLKVISNIRFATLLEDNAVDEAIDKIGLRRKVRVFQSDKIESPFVCGFITPKVYIPENISEKELSYILLHELVHVKRADYLIKPFSYLILIIHWFNPILWISFSLMSKDMEMSCDERVLGMLGEKIKSDYSNSLLSLAVNNNRLLQGSPLAFGESNVKSRIKNVLKFKKLSSFIAVIVVILIGVVGFMLVANPNSLNMEKNFIPKSIEIDINDGMENIEFNDEESSKVSELLQYDKWQKSKMEYDLATTTYIGDKFGDRAKKVIGLYEDVDGFTFIQLYSGFGLKNGDFYKAPLEVYKDIEDYLTEQNSIFDSFKPDVEKEIIVVTEEEDLIKIGMMILEKKFSMYMNDGVDDVEEILSYSTNSASYVAGDINEFVVVIDYELEAKVENSIWQSDRGLFNGLFKDYRYLRIKKVSESSYQLIGFGKGDYVGELPQYELFDFRELDNVARKHGYDSGIILKMDFSGTELLLYNNEINSEKDLVAKKLYLNMNQDIVDEEEVNLSSELIGYSLRFREREYSFGKYLLGYRTLSESTDNKVYTDLLVMVKGKLQELNILQSYTRNPSSEGIIPNAIETSIDIIDDYIVYEDVDEYWKVQDIRTKEIFNSKENSSLFNDIEPFTFNDGEYISILRYTEDNLILVFDKRSKEFKKIDEDIAKASEN